MSLDHVLQLVLDHEAFLCTVLALVISELLPFVKGRAEKYNGILQGVVTFLEGRAAAKAKLKAVVLLPVALLASLSGCAFCKDAVNSTAPRCVLEQNMIRCGESAGFALVPLVLGLIAGAIAGQPFDPSVLGQQLLQQGVKDVPCVLAALEDYLLGSKLAKQGDPASLMLAAQVHAALLDSLAAKGLHGRLQLKLRDGHVVEAEVP